MGCNNSGEEPTIESEAPIEELNNIRDQLEGNLIPQSTLNAELENWFKKLKDSGETDPDKIVADFMEFLINIIFIKLKNESKDVKELLAKIMSYVNGNCDSFYLIIFVKLQGLKDYSNVQQKISSNTASISGSGKYTVANYSFRETIIRNNETLLVVFIELKKENIINISQLIFERFEELCKKHGVTMTDEELKAYYDLLKTTPKEGDEFYKEIRENLDNNVYLKNLVKKNQNGIHKLINKVYKEGIDLSKYNYEEFEKMCKECGIKMEEKCLKECFDLIHGNFPAFISYMSNCIDGNQDNLGNLIRQANKLFILANIELQALPVAQKLEKNF